MQYTTSQAAKKAGLSAYTLRYYDKEGLLPFIDRTESGQRLFKESDFSWLGLISCLKNTGMSIKDIRRFVDWCLEGDTTLGARLDMFRRQKAQVQARIDELRHYMEKLDHKISLYEAAVANGTDPTAQMNRPERPDLH